MTDFGLMQYRLGFFLLRKLPKKLVESLTSGLASVLAIPRSSKKTIIEKNLKRAGAFAEIPGDDKKTQKRFASRAIRKAFISYGKYYIDSSRLPYISKEKIDAGFTQDGFIQIREALDKKTGAILALPHMGSWEWAGTWLAKVQNVEVTAVVEPIGSQKLFEWIKSVRNSMGIKVVPLGSGTMSAISSALKKNHVVCLLCDRDISGTGLEIEFFGENTTLPGGPATLALRSGAPLFPVGIYKRRDNDGTIKNHAVVLPAVSAKKTGKLRQDVIRITQDLTHKLEDLIRLAPEQWHLMQPNWPSDF